MVLSCASHGWWRVRPRHCDLGGDLSSPFEPEFPECRSESVVSHVGIGKAAASYSGRFILERSRHEFAKFLVCFLFPTVCCVPVCDNILFKQVCKCHHTVKRQNDLCSALHFKAPCWNILVLLNVNLSVCWNHCCNLFFTTLKALQGCLLSCCSLCFPPS